MPAAGLESLRKWCRPPYDPPEPGPSADRGAARFCVWAATPTTSKLVVVAPFCGWPSNTRAASFTGWCSAPLGVREAEAQRAAELFAGPAQLKGPLLKTFPDGFMPFVGAEVKASF